MSEKTNSKTCDTNSKTCDTDNSKMNNKSTRFVRKGKFIKITLNNGV